MLGFVFMLLAGLAVAAVIGAIVALPILFIKKRFRPLLLLLGIAAILGAFPLGFWSEFLINGCCGAPSTGNEGVGVLIGIVIGIAGIFLIVISRRFKK